MTEQHNEAFGDKPWHAKISRRSFIGTGLAAAGIAGFAGYLPDSVLRAAAAAAPPTSEKSFDLSQVKHLVFMMMENRSYDHYFGAHPGGAGFSDPRAIRLPNGNSVFQQPDPNNPDGYLEPFHLDTVLTGATTVPSLSHSWEQQHASWNNGAMDGWLAAHMAFDGAVYGQFSMGYYNRSDLPFHWALADNFTLLDHYHSSVLGPTTPNRCFWQNGTNDPQGLGGGPLLDTAGGPPQTYPSGAGTLFDAGISFNFYTPFLTGNDVWANFSFSDIANGPAALSKPAKSAGILYGNGTPGGIGDPANPTLAANPLYGFEEDCANGVLPDVSFIYPGVNQEHPSDPPPQSALGAQVIAQKLDALASNEELWNTTVFVLNYDENDGFFDHVVPPTPNPEEYPEEFVTKNSTQLGTPGGGLPVGGGFRVPCIVISPWTVGGRIYSGLNDHTSCLRLIEAVAAAGGLSGKGPVTFPNISRWRRQTFGDLTGVLGGVPHAAPASPQFDPAIRAANVAARTASAKLPIPPLPQADQTMPKQ